MRSHVKYTAGFVLVIFFFVVCCKKENRNGWLVVDVYTKDALTGEPAPGALVRLCYYQFTLLGSYAEEPIDFGYTDENGYLHVEWEIPRKADNFKIAVWPYGKYAVPYNYISNYSCENLAGIGVNSGQLNTINKSFYPYARYRFHYVNQSCFDSNDSIRINVNMTGGPDADWPYTKVIHGCADTINPYSASSNDGFIWTRNQELEIEKHIYKNGWDTIIYQQENLNADGEIQLIEIVY